MQPLLEFAERAFHFDRTGLDGDFHAFRDLHGGFADTGHVLILES
jgi:hypothetical protein